jgi:hypothetical protein
MENRAKNTLTFQYIKIPEVSLIVSYKIRVRKKKPKQSFRNHFFNELFFVCKGYKRKKNW